MHGFPPLAGATNAPITPVLRGGPGLCRANGEVQAPVTLRRQIRGVVDEVERAGFRVVELLPPAPVRRFLPQLIDLIWNREIDPGKVFDLDLPLEQAAEGHRAMDERRAVKTLLRP
jgi:threonine dehydrogenase-like Zn-dependent dehydrogenase